MDHWHHYIHIYIYYILYDDVSTVSHRSTVRDFQSMSWQHAETLKVSTKPWSPSLAPQPLLWAAEVAYYLQANGACCAISLMCLKAGVKTWTNITMIKRIIWFNTNDNKIFKWYFCVSLCIFRVIIPQSLAIDLISDQMRSAISGWGRIFQHGQIQTILLLHHLQHLASWHHQARQGSKETISWSHQTLQIEDFDNPLFCCQ